MKLIEFDGLEFKIADEALLVRPIRELFEKDKSKKKEEFWRQISYLWFMCDPRSNYMYLIDADDRAEEVKKQEGFPPDWEPSELLKDAMYIYRRQTITTSALLLEKMRKGADSIGDFLESVDLSALDKNGKPIYQIASITSAVKQIPEIARAISEAEKALAKDLQQMTRQEETQKRRLERIFKVVISGEVTETDEYYIYPVRVFDRNNREISTEEFAKEWLRL